MEDIRESVNIVSQPVQSKVADMHHFPLRPRNVVVVTFIMIIIVVLNSRPVALLIYVVEECKWKLCANCQRQRNEMT